VLDVVKQPLDVGLGHNFQMRPMQRMSADVFG
jgi:hypothetical protein